MANTTDSNKQTRETAKKARAIRRRRTRGETWEKIAREENIIKEDGSPDTGLAYKIAQGYEPKRQETRDRLGLKKFCSTCMRGFRRHLSGSNEDLAPWRLFWRRLRPEDRDRRIREIYEKENR